MSELAKQESGLGGEGLGGEVRTEWWCQPEVARDSYIFGVARYHRPNLEDRTTWWAEYLDENGQWHTIPEGAQIPYALRLSGIFIHTLQGAEMLDRAPITEALKNLCCTVFNSLLSEQLNVLEEDKSGSNTNRAT